MKELVVFDLDGTLAESKSPIDAEMAQLLDSLLDIVNVAVISGGAWKQFETQVLARLSGKDPLRRLSLLPTCGTKFYAYQSSWKLLYSEDFSPEEKTKIIDSLKQAVASAAFAVEKVWARLLRTEEAKSHSPRWASRLRLTKRRSGIRNLRSERR